MRVVVINGTGGVGKDTFIRMCQLHTPPGFHIHSYSSIDLVKKYARRLGYDGHSNTDKDKKFLSDLKLALSEWNDSPFESMAEHYNIAVKSGLCCVLFLTIREPEEIKRAVNEFNAVTLLIKNRRVKPIIANYSDSRVFDYHYDFVISNDGSLKELSEKAAQFMREVI